MTRNRLSLARIVASCLGLGFLRPAPGTIGSAFGLAVFLLLLAPMPLWGQVAATAVATAVGIAAATASERQLGREDPSEVVIDELAGVWIALWTTTSWQVGLLAFALFRLFDITKPFPARRAEALPEGWGIMADDLVAGLYALIATRLIVLWWVP